MPQPLPTETIETVATGFDAHLQCEVEKAVWGLEATLRDVTPAEVSIGQIRDSLGNLQSGAAEEGYVLAAAVCESACRVIDTGDTGPGQQRSLREHINALRNIVIASLQGRAYGNLDAASTAA